MPGLQQEGGEVGGGGKGAGEGVCGRIGVELIAVDLGGAVGVEVPSDVQQLLAGQDIPCSLGPIHHQLQAWPLGLDRGGILLGQSRDKGLGGPLTNSAALLFKRKPLQARTPGL